jgi:hypothetical protein
LGEKHGCIVLPVFPAGTEHNIQVTLG